MATKLTELNGNYTLDAAHSTVGFVARHAMITKVRGSMDATGEAVLVGSDPAASSINVTADVASIDTGNADRDGHLKSADFFQVESFPTMTFNSTAVELKSDTEVDVTGDLTVKDVTRQVTFPMEFTGEVVDPFGTTRAGFEGSTTIKRSDFGLTWNAAIEAGGVLVSDKITIELDIALTKND